MKRILAMILFVISCLVLVVSIIFAVYGVVDINRVSNELATNPGASGIDYLGIGWAYGIGLFIVSVLGLILSGISKKLQQQKNLQDASSFEMIAFSLLLVISFFIFCM